MNEAGSTTSRPRHLSGQVPQPMSLRGQIALVIGLLSFLPNMVIALVLVRLAGVSDVSGVLVWMLAVAVVSVVVGYGLSVALLRPLSRLTGEIEDGGVGDAQRDDPPEIRSLRDAFAGLLARFTRERDRRSAFMATLVHDLKTPLIATNHLVEVLRDVPLGQPDRDGIFRQLLDENVRLLNLVRQMADAYRLEREGISLTFQRVQFEELAARLAVRFQRQADEVAVTLRADGQGELHADPDQLDRALSNLLDNAMRYARTEVTLELHPGLLRVTDDGPGLAEPLDRLAQPFNAQPVEIAGLHYTAGTAGLGLFIARRVAQAHGGDLHYHRRGDRSVFEMHLTPPEPAVVVPAGRGVPG